MHCYILFFKRIPTWNILPVNYIAMKERVGGEKTLQLLHPPRRASRRIVIKPLEPWNSGFPRDRNHPSISFFPISSPRHRRKPPLIRLQFHQRYRH